MSEELPARFARRSPAPETPKLSDAMPARALSAPTTSSGGSAPVPVTASPEAIRDTLVNAVGLGSRARDVRRKGQLVDRRAAAYTSNLVRQCARLISQVPDSVPVLRPSSGNNTSALRHHVVRHDQLPDPARVRLLVVSSDGRLRTCTICEDGLSPRLWEHYDVQDPPPGLEIEVVFAALSALIVTLDAAVTQVEEKQQTHERRVLGAIEESTATLAEGMANNAARASNHRTPDDADPLPPASANDDEESMADPLSVVEDLFGNVTMDSVDASTPKAASANGAPAVDASLSEEHGGETEASATHERRVRPFRFSRLHKAT